jgi:hypothetical protein
MADRRLFLNQLAGYPAGFLLTFINWISPPEISFQEYLTFGGFPKIALIEDNEIFYDPKYQLGC